MIHSKLSFEESAAALELAENKLAEARKKAESVDAKHAEASAAHLAATEIQTALAGRIANGSGVKSSEAGAAAPLVAEAREHLVLIVGAKAIAATAVDAADEAWRHARYSHALHSIRAARRARAAALRVLAKAGEDFGAAVEAASAAGEAFLQAEHDAKSAAKLPAAFAMTAPFDMTKVSVQSLARALPGFVISAVNKVPLDHVDFLAEADREDKEANS